MLVSIAQSPRRLSYFTHGKETGVTLREDSITKRLADLVEAGFLYEAESCWHITMLGRQKLDQKDTATPRAIVTKGGTYRTGDSDPFVSVPRPGSDHSHIKSRGNLC